MPRIPDEDAHLVYAIPPAAKRLSSQSVLRYSILTLSLRFRSGSPLRPWTLRAACRSFQCALVRQHVEHGRRLSSQYFPIRLRRVGSCLHPMRKETLRDAPARAAMSKNVGCADPQQWRAVDRGGVVAEGGGPPTQPLCSTCIATPIFSKCSLFVPPYSVALTKNPLSVNV